MPKRTTLFLKNKPSRNYSVPEFWVLFVLFKNVCIDFWAPTLNTKSHLCIAIWRRLWIKLIFLQILRPRKKISDFWVLRKCLYRFLGSNPLDQNAPLHGHVETTLTKKHRFVNFMVKEYSLIFGLFKYVHIDFLGSNPYHQNSPLHGHIETTLKKN